MDIIKVSFVRDNFEDRLILEVTEGMDVPDVLQDWVSRTDRRYRNWKASQSEE